MPKLTALRRHARTRGYRLWKVSERSRWFNQYGPFCLVDLETGAVVHRSLTAEEVSALVAV